MTNQEHPITPPPELVEQWSDIKPMEDVVVQNWVKIATQAARWAADQELEECCNIVLTSIVCGTKHQRRQLVYQIREARRPKPPSLKEQALAALKRQEIRSISSLVSANDCDTIRRALEQLND